MSDLDEFRRPNSRKASVIHVGGFRSSGDPLASHFCLTPVGREDEAWPSHNGKPLLFVCQLNLTTAPAIPELLKDIVLMTFFLDPEIGLRSEVNGADWVLRAYKTLDDLVPMKTATGAPRVGRGFECRWEEIVDQAVDDDPDLIIPDGFDASGVHLGNVRRTKLGGYASNIQSEPWWGYREHPAAPNYCWQIDSEEKVGLIWGDSGIIYLARGTAAGCEGQWFLDWQCY